MKKCLQNMNVRDKKVILRVDYNVPIQNGTILDDSKIKETLETIFYLISENCRVIILSHLGKIKSAADKEKNTLEPVSKRLSELLGREVFFSKENFGIAVEERVKSLQAGDILMLENTRFLDFPNRLESKCDSQLSLFWASLGDVFVNDAFGSAHRKHASNYGIAEHLPNCIGFLMQKEIGMLNRLVVHAIHPFVVIMGGAKIDDKILLMESMLSKCEYLLCGGGIANTCLYALGFEVGESLVCSDPAILARVRAMLLRYKDKIMLPLDVIVGSTYDKNYIRYKLINEVDTNDIILDIGVKTLNKYKTALDQAETIFLNGTVGLYENMKYANGTKELLNMLAQNKAITVIGGGDAAASVRNFGFEKDFTYISSGGGATLDYLATENLVALSVIGEEDSIETLDL